MGQWLSPKSGARAVGDLGAGIQLWRALTAIAHSGESRMIRVPTNPEFELVSQWVRDLLDSSTKENRSQNNSVVMNLIMRCKNKRDPPPLSKGA
jgi:hypothetical protein